MVLRSSGGRGRLPWRRAILCGCVGTALVAVSVTRWGSPAGASADAGPQAGVAVVVAAADLPPGAVVESTMLATAAVPASLASEYVRDPSRLLGRTLLVAVTRGEPIAEGMAARHPQPAAGRRLLRVPLAAVDVAPDVRPGAVAEVVASFAGTASGDEPSVRVVATVVVVALAAQTAGQTSAGAPSSVDPATGAAAGGSAGTDAADATTAATLDCSSTDALRVLWARDNARSLRLLAHPAGDTQPPVATVA